jgi:4,5-dihydroxyphthalate decarboxylase
MVSRSSTLTLRALMGDYPNTIALKRGDVRSSIIDFDFADIKVPGLAFKRTVRNLEFDVSELDIVTYFQARAHDKAVVLVPAAITGGRPPHAAIVYNGERGELAPWELAGRRVGIRSTAVTTVMWLRGILASDYGVDLDGIRWVSFEDPNVAEYSEPDSVERAPTGRKAFDMLIDGELDAAVLYGNELKDARLRPLLPDASAAAEDWVKKHKLLPIGHMLVVKQSLSRSSPAMVEEIFRLVAESKERAGLTAKRGSDPLPLGVSACRKCLELALEYSYQQALIPHRMEVDDLFDDVTRALRP